MEKSSSTADEDSATDDDESCSHLKILDPLKAQLASAIEELGGHVVPKLNWSAPVDATWISPDGLRCCNPDEILLLLKSSARVAHDLRCVHNSPWCCEQAAEQAAEPTLPAADGIQRQHQPVAVASAQVRPEIVLKKFKTLNHSMEFRAFVLDSTLVGISQRDPTQHFPAMQDLLRGISCAIKDFYRKEMAAKFDRPHCAIPAIAFVCTFFWPMCDLCVPCNVLLFWSSKSRKLVSSHMRMSCRCF